MDRSVVASGAGLLSDAPGWVVGADALVALAYCAIAIAFGVLIRGRPERRFPALAWLFAAFFLVAASERALDVWSAWQVPSRVEGPLALLSAAVSVAAAVGVWRLLSKLMSLPSPMWLETHNRELRHELAERQRAEAALRRTQGELEDRVHERTAALENVNRVLEREIAERKWAEQRFRRAVESSPAGMLMVDAKGVIVLANRAAQAIFGYRGDDLIGRPIELVVPERFRSEHSTLREEFLRQPTTRAMGAGRDLFGRRADGSEVPIEIGLNPIHTDEGTFVLSSVVDITERKHAEHTIEAKHQELGRSLRDLDEFAHVVSHDLKAPLRGIVSLSSWVLEDCAGLLPPESQQHLESLEERTRRMSELIDGILRYSRVGSQGGRPQEIRTSELLRDVIDSLAVPESIRIRVEGTFPTVFYDRTQLRQILQNLVGNAIQHLGRPTGEVMVSCRADPHDYVFAVRDDGPGIDETHLSRIFRIFHSMDPDRPGTGVGLAIVKKIVERNGGSIRVASRTGAGATFEFTVPKRRHRPVAGFLDRGQT
jgi:PAS domain S-box-containing protein